MRWPSFALFSSIVAIKSATGVVNGCPYDILAMCCVASGANGGCGQWVNCCEIFGTITSGESDEQHQTNTQVSLVAGKSCVDRCNGGGGGGTCSVNADGTRICDGCEDSTRSLNSVFACYSSCAERADDGGGCIVLSNSTSQFGPRDKCCVLTTTRDRELAAVGDYDYYEYHYDYKHWEDHYDDPPNISLLCEEWQDCRLIERSPSRYGPYYLPKADGICVERCDRNARSFEERSICYQRCANPVGGFDGPFGFDDLQAPCIEVPTLSGHSTAFVPMKPVAIGIDINTFGLATENGNLNMNLHVSFCCNSNPISSLKILDVPDDVQVLVPMDSSSFSGSVSVQPFTLEDLEDACETALGGSWTVPGSPNNSEQTVDTIITKQVTIVAQCETEEEISRVYDVSLDPTTCFDTSFFEPVP